MEVDGLSLEKEEEGEQSLSEGEQDYSVKEVILFNFDLKNTWGLSYFSWLCLWWFRMAGPPSKKWAWATWAVIASTTVTQSTVAPNYHHQWFSSFNWLISCLIGASFFVPVAGFICTLCSKFFHFESPAVHTHCKSSTHFEKLKVGLMIGDEQSSQIFILAECLEELMQKSLVFFTCCCPQRYRETLSQKSKAAASSRENLCAADSPGPPTEASRSSAAEKPSSDDTGAVTHSVQSMPALSRLKENQQPEDHAEPNAAAQVFSSSAEQELLSREDETVSLLSGVQETPVELPFSMTEEEEPGAAAKDDDDEEEGKEVAAVPGESKNSGKARATPKRRSVRVTNRRWGNNQTWKPWNKRFFQETETKKWTALLVHKISTEWFSIFGDFLLTWIVLPGWEINSHPTEGDTVMFSWNS